MEFQDNISKQLYEKIVKLPPISGLYYTEWYVLSPPNNMNILAEGTYDIGCGGFVSWIISDVFLFEYDLQIKIPSPSRYIWRYIPFMKETYSDGQLDKFLKLGGVFGYEDNIFFFTNSIKFPMPELIDDDDEGNTMFIVLYDKMYTKKWKDTDPLKLIKHN